jgi:hypothetical protein
VRERVVTAFDQLLQDGRLLHDPEVSARGDGVVEPDDCGELAGVHHIQPCIP